MCEMSRPEVDGLNTGYAALLLEQYLDNPSAVPSEWRALFESAPEELLATQPGLARLLERIERNGGNGRVAPVAEAPPAPALEPPPVTPPAPAQRDSTRSAPSRTAIPRSSRKG
jgi:2-oxoglutarate dehydrogenase complex dehydrogenase (E1) component-like enzyme